MNEKKEKEIIEEVAITTSSQDSTANNTDLEIEQVIEKIDLLSHPIDDFPCGVFPSLPAVITKYNQTKMFIKGKKLPTTKRLGGIPISLARREINHQCAPIDKNKPMSARSSTVAVAPPRVAVIATPTTKSIGRMMSSETIQNPSLPIVGKGSELYFFDS